MFVLLKYNKKKEQSYFSKLTKQTDLIQFYTVKETLAIKDFSVLSTRRGNLIKKTSETDRGINSISTWHVGSLDTKKRLNPELHSLKSVCINLTNNK